MSHITKEDIQRVKSGKVFVQVNDITHYDAEDVKINGYSLPELLYAAEEAAVYQYRERDVVLTAGMFGVALDKGGILTREAQLCNEVSDRLLPRGMTWPKFEDGEPVTGGDIIDQNEYCEADANFVVLALDGSCYELLSDYDGELHEAGERIKRPEPKQDTLQDVIRSIIYELSIKDHCEDDAGFLWKIIERLKALEERMGGEGESKADSPVEIPERKTCPHCGRSHVITTKVITIGEGRYRESETDLCLTCGRDLPGVE